MRALSAQDIARLVDWGLDKHPVDRSLAALRLALPDGAPEALAAMPLGRRNQLLLELRALTFGPELEIQVQCPQCDERLEFEAPVAVFQVPCAATSEPLEREFEGRTLRYRVATSEDAAAVAELEDQVEARAVLQARLLLGVDGEPPETPLDEELAAALTQALDEADPAADVTFPIGCSVCGYDWYVPFDSPSFFWAEANDYARRLEVQVDRLARAYGWSEEQILRMSESKRARYLRHASGDDE